VNAYQAQVILTKIAICISDVESLYRAYKLEISCIAVFIR
jgi:hypothetical protein